jgi:hypothetical protein
MDLTSGPALLGELQFIRMGICPGWIVTLIIGTTTILLDFTGIPTAVCVLEKVSLELAIEVLYKD